MNKLVSIGIPIYKRLHYLPDVLNIVSAQDYPHIELLVSDNGMNGTSVSEIIKKHYSRPFKLRQNASTVGLSRHFNQIIDEASGEYFLMLADDDEISPNYVSELVSQLERHPNAKVAISHQHIIDESGAVIRQSEDKLPELRLGRQFIRDTWHTYKYGFECFATFLARTSDIRECGGYPDFTKGNHNDNALLIKLCINSYIVLSDRCTFRWRRYDSSHGWSISIEDLAESTIQFLQFLESDPRIQKFALSHPTQWRELKGYLVKMAWGTYIGRWSHLYKNRLSYLQWIRAAFAMPFIPAYYTGVAVALAGALKAAMRRQMKQVFRIA